MQLLVPTKNNAKFRQLPSLELRVSVVAWHHLTNDNINFKVQYTATFSFNFFVFNDTFSMFTLLMLCLVANFS